MPTPTVGRVVHYVSFGTPGGEYTSQCRTAIITEVPRSLEKEPLDGCPNGTQGEWTVSLAVLNPTGMFFNQAVQHHDGAEATGTPGCPDSASHGHRFRYCACGWVEASHVGGTWHWPERIDG